MGKVFDEISDKLAEWINRQQMFFVSTAPLSASGHVSCSPKGGDSFRILGPNSVAYQDYAGSGVETIAHVLENERILIMFCAFEGGPKIVRLHGKGLVHREGDSRFAELIGQFPYNAGTRSIIEVQVTRISDSCGYAVPLYDYLGQRDVLDKWAEKKGEEGVKAYIAEKNAESIDGISAK